jgi:squalene cyclase
MKHTLLMIAGVVLALAWTEATSAAGAQNKPDKNDDQARQVRQAVEKGIQYLRNKQRADGSWEVDDFCVVRPGGWTALALLALLNAGVSPDETMVKKGLDYLRKQEPTFTYVRALQTMVYAAAGKKEDGKRIQRNADWLINAAIESDGQLLGWTYTGGSRQAPDNSNTQYAVLGLHAARLAGARIPRAVWQKVRDFYLRTQLKEGGWVYARHHNNRTYLTMDVAGLSGLFASGLALKMNRPAILKQAPVQLALDWISGHRFDIALTDKVYYNLAGVARLGRISGLGLLGKHDWYQEGCKFLLKEQAQDGSWPGRGVQFDKWPFINTCYALMFLKGK